MSLETCDECGFVSADIDRFRRIYDTRIVCLDCLRDIERDWEAEEGSR